MSKKVYRGQHLRGWSFEAKYPGGCKACKNIIRVGDELRKVSTKKWNSPFLGEWIHMDCWKNIRRQFNRSNNV